MKDIIFELKNRSLKLSTAESCTGGLLASTITDISGASEVFELGFVTYSNQTKIDKLGVDPEIIEIFGVYSLETAGAMAKAIAKKSGADIGIGITGVAGSEAQEGIPSGKVFISLYAPDAFIFAETEPTPNAERTEIKQNAVNAAIKLLKDYLNRPLEK